MQLQVNTGDSEAKLKTIKQQLQEIEKQKDSLVQQSHKGNIAGADYQEKVNALLKKEISLRKQLAQLESLNLSNRDKALQNEATQRKAIADAESKALREKQKKSEDFAKFLTEQENKGLKQELKAADAYDKYIRDLRSQQNLQSNKQSIVDEENARKRRTAEHIAGWESFGSQDNFTSYIKQLRELNNSAEKYHQQWKSGVITQKEYNNEITNLSKQAEKLKINMKEVPDLLSGTTASSSYLGSFFQKLR